MSPFPMSKLLRNVLWFDSLEMSSRTLKVQVVAMGFIGLYLDLQG